MLKLLHSTGPSSADKPVQVIFKKKEKKTIEKNKSIYPFLTYDFIHKLQQASFHLKQCISASALHDFTLKLDLFIYSFIFFITVLHWTE